MNLLHSLGNIFLSFFLYLVSNIYLPLIICMPIVCVCFPLIPYLPTSKYLYLSSFDSLILWVRLDFLLKLCMFLFPCVFCVELLMCMLVLFVGVSISNVLSVVDFDCHIITQMTKLPSFRPHTTRITHMFERFLCQIRCIINVA